MKKDDIDKTKITSTNITDHAYNIRSSSIANSEISANITAIRPKDYSPAINYLSEQTAKISGLANQINSISSELDLSNILTTINSVQENFAHLSSIHSYLPVIDNHVSESPILQATREAVLSISRLATPSVVSGISTDLIKSSPHMFLGNISERIIQPETINKALDIKSINEKLAPLIGLKDLSTLSFQSDIARATEFSIFAEKSLSTITNENLGSKLSIAFEEKNQLSASFYNLGESYSSLLKSFESNPLSYAQINPSITRIVPHEYFTSANFLESISVDEDITPAEERLKNEIQDENKIVLKSYLEKVDPKLFNLWQGAMGAYNSDNADKVRHFSVSIRELFTHLIHFLAPNNELKHWSNDPSHYHNGRPTRKARLLYICRNINHDPLNKFVIKDIDAMIAFIDVFQKGTHDINPQFTSDQLVAIKSKAENTLRFLLEIHFTGSYYPPN